MTTTISILNVLAEAAKTRLEDQLRTQISDDSKAGLVRIGKPDTIQENPNEMVMTIIVRPATERWRHTLNIPQENIGMRAPIGEIGGTLYWRRRFEVEFKLFFSEAYDQDESRTVANVLLSRTEWVLGNKLSNGSWWFSTAPDDFQESASGVQVYDSYLEEGGGEGSWIWRGIALIEFLTTRPGCI